MAKTLIISAREFNQAHSVYVTKLSHGVCRKILVTRRGVPWIILSLAKARKWAK